MRPHTFAKVSARLRMTLVYLDALDLSERFQLPDIPPVPYVAGVDDRSLQVFQAAVARLENTLEPAAAVCIGVQFDAKGAITDPTTPDWVPQKILLVLRTPQIHPPIGHASRR